MREPRGCVCLVLLATCASWCTPAAAIAADEPSPPLRIELQPASKAHGASFDVIGLSDSELAAFNELPLERRRQVFAVTVQSDLADPPAIGGTYKSEGNRLRFTPRYPLEPGVSYRAVFDRARLGGNVDDATLPVAAVFGIAKPDARPTTVVTHIYPSSDQLPENQLKFYIHFSAPMSRGEAYRRVHLLDAAGREVEAVFLELGEELWDGSGQRFTLYFEPGRIKRGLRPREELGPILEEGKSYTLVVDAGWRDAHLLPLAAGARKTFSVGPPDDLAIDPARWQLETPPAGSVMPLVVRFGESLDESQLQRVVWIAGDSAQRLAGQIATDEHEAVWKFTPERPWTAGNYNLVAETTLEDLAGNSIGQPFEVDVFGPVQKRVETKTVSIPFSVAAPR